MNYSGKIAPAQDKRGQIYFLCVPAGSGQLVHRNRVHGQVSNCTCAKYATIIALLTHDPKPTNYYRGLLNDFQKLSRLTIEIYACKDDSVARTLDYL